MKRTKDIMFLWASILGLTIIFGGCDSGTRLSPDQKEIMENCIRFFTQVKVNNHDALYDNEFPYFQEERDREEYLSLPGIAGYRADTLLAIQIDSITVWDRDTAYVHMQLEYLLSDSTTTLKNISWRWYDVGDTIWIKPSISGIERQLDFEEELRVYWEAVRELERREKEREGQKEDSEP